MPVAVPIGTHDPTRKVQLDVVDTVHDLFSDTTDKALGTVTLLSAGRWQGVACGGREEVA